MKAQAGPLTTDDRPQKHRLPPCGLWSVVCALTAVLFLLSPGCATLPISPPEKAPAIPKASNALDDGYEDYAGVIHIHTNYSDGAGTYEEIARIANAQSLDYLVVSDHNTLKALREGQQGWRGKTLILVGMEISTRAGHYLAMNVTQEIDRSKLTAQQIIDEVNRQGGLGFIAHPYFKKRRWTDWTVKDFTGMEIYNVAHDSLDENRLRLAIWTITVPTEPFYFSIIDRPYDPLAKWDELIAKRGRIVGIGSSDAHEVRLFGIKFAPYEIMFQLIRTHLLIASHELTEQGIYDALRNGHAYAAIELSANAKGFSFMAEDGKNVLGIMGDELSYNSGLYLNISLPSPAKISLFKDGKVIGTLTDQFWRIPVDSPGVYRVEATRHEKPWIMSNPIYVRPQEQH